jgi:hypothetical protein
VSFTSGAIFTGGLTVSSPVLINASMTASGQVGLSCGLRISSGNLDVSCGANINNASFSSRVDFKGYVAFASRVDHLASETFTDAVGFDDSCVDFSCGFKVSSGDIKIGTSANRLYVSGGKLMYDDDGTNNAQLALVVASSTTATGDYPDGTIWIQHA